MGKRLDFKIEKLDSGYIVKINRGFRNQSEKVAESRHKLIELLTKEIKDIFIDLSIRR